MKYYVRVKPSITCYADYFAVHLLRKYTTMLGFLPHFIYPYRVFVKENFSQKIRAVLRLLSIPVDTAYFLSLFINHKFWIFSILLICTYQNKIHTCQNTEAPVFSKFRLQLILQIGFLIIKEFHSLSLSSSYLFQ